jgi:hypothetical protein
VVGKLRSWRVLATALVLVAISLIAAACGGGGSSSSTEVSSETEATAPAKEAEAPETEEAETSEPSEYVATNWELPNANQTETRDVAGEIKESNVNELGVAWPVPIVGHGR